MAETCPDCGRRYAIHRQDWREDVCTNNPPGDSYSGENNCVRVAYARVRAQLARANEVIAAADVLRERLQYPVWGTQVTERRIELSRYDAAREAFRKESGR